MKKQLILGYGYTASFLSPLLDDEGCEVLRTSRKNPDSILFNLEDSTSWQNIPQVSATYWMFPAAPLELVKKFYQQNKNKLGQIVVIGSTSGFQSIQDGEEIRESSPLDLNIERVQGEEFLRSQGAIVVMASGIYGQGRSPLDWVKKAYVGKSKKFVNMIHVLDLCQFLINAQKYGEKGKLYIASDNYPQTWESVISVWQERGLLDREVAEKETQRLSKKMNSTQSIEELRINLKFQNFADLVL